jgi:hypothetical protein
LQQAATPLQQQQQPNNQDVCPFYFGPSRRSSLHRAFFFSQHPNNPAFRATTNFPPDKAAHNVADKMSQAAHSVKQSVHDAVAPSYTEQAKQSVWENTGSSTKTQEELNREQVHNETAPSMYQQAKDALHSNTQPSMTEQAKNAVYDATKPSTAESVTGRLNEKTA